MTHPISFCRVCSFKYLIRRFTVHNYEILRCHNCGFEQIAQEPSQTQLNAIYAESYFLNQKYAGNNLAIEREEYRRLNLLRRFTPLQSEVLDAGCATGEFIFRAKDYYLMYGVDYSSFAVGLALKRNPDLENRLYSGPLENALRINMQFDAICLWDVIEHIFDPIVVLENLLTHTKPGGSILLSTPAIDTVMARLMGRYWPFMTPPEHMSFWSRKAFEYAINKIGGCEIVHHSRHGKWANLAFIAYKINRIMPAWFPAAILKPFKVWPLSTISVYVPTGDVQYLVIRKNK